MVAFAHRNHFTLAPRGVHVWRQCNTLAVAKNFYLEEMNILKPRVDNRKGTNGVTGSAFPLFEYLLAILYRIFGFSEHLHRYLQFFFTSTLVFGSFYLGLTLLKNSVFAAATMSWVLAWSPEMYYHGITALPDVAAMALSCWGLFAYVKTKKSNKVVWYFLSMTLISIAGLIKLQYLMFIGVIFIDEFVNRHTFQIIQRRMMMFFALLPSIAWYSYAIWLREQTGLKDYGLLMNPANDLLEAFEILTSNLLSDLPEQLLGYGFLCALIVGVYYFFSSGLMHLKKKVILVCIGLIVFHLIELGQMRFHGYYMMPYILFMALACGFGLQQLLNTNKRNTGKLLLTYSMFILLILQPFITTARINHRYEDPAKSALPSEFDKEVELRALRNSLNGSHHVMIHPDPSGCIFFYFLQCKGWNVSDLSKMDIHRLQEEIALIHPEYIVLYKSEVSDNDLRRIGLLKVIGDFKLVKIR